MGQKIANISKINKPDWKIRLSSLLLSCLITALSFWAIFSQVMNARDYKEAYSVKFEFSPVEIIKPQIIEIPKNEIQKTENLKAESQNDNQEKNNLPQKNLIIPTIPNQHISKNTFNNQNPQSGTNTQTGPVENGAFLPKTNGKILSDASQKTLHDIECQKLDEKERPKDCPPSNLAKKMIDQAFAPKYRPEKVEGFSRGEINSKYMAGWRDKCQREDGSQYQACFAIGKKPPRVKTPYELCIEKGLGGCTRPPMPDGSKSPAYNYGN